MVHAVAALLAAGHESSSSQIKDEAPVVTESFDPCLAAADDGSSCLIAPPTLIRHASSSSKRQPSCSSTSPLHPSQLISSFALSFRQAAPSWLHSPNVCGRFSRHLSTVERELLVLGPKTVLAKQVWLLTREARPWSARLGDVVAQCEGVGLTNKKSRVRSPARAQLHNDSGQVVHTRVQCASTVDT